MYDVNHDGFCSFGEFARVISILVRGSKEQKLELFFDSWNLNDDNVLSIDELKKAFSVMYEGDSQKGIDQRIASFLQNIDYNGNGLVSKTEFMSLASGGVGCYANCSPSSKGIANRTIGHLATTTGAQMVLDKPDGFTLGLLERFDLSLLVEATCGVMSA